VRAAAFTFLALWGIQADAQTTHKCVDAQKRITYSNVACDKQGLKSAGPVAERTTTMPLGPAPAPAAADAKPAAKAKPPAARDEFDTRGGTQVKPVSPLLETLLK